MAQVVTTDAKKDEFKRYLKTTGVLEELTKVLVQLFQEANRPDDAMAYVRKKLLAQETGGDDSAGLKAELDKATQRIGELEKELAELKGE